MEEDIKKQIKELELHIVKCQENGISIERINHWRNKIMILRKKLKENGKEEEN